ncbi:MAG: NUDIX hydrolase [Pseudomonadota bacterium]
MKYCSSCGGPIEYRIPEGDDRERAVCTQCGDIHYVNPKVIVGCLASYEDKVLLCKRAIEPRCGLWTLPAGFMENRETTREGAARETWEEARAKVSDLELYRVFDVPYISQVYMFYRCHIPTGEHGAGPESLESELFTEQEVPWSEIAFPVVKLTLEAFFEDRKSNDFPMRVEDVLFRRPPVQA